MRGSDQETRDAIQVLARAFYPLEGGIDALRPDILGERLVARELARDDELLDLALGEGADGATRMAALAVLTRLAQHSEGGDLWLRRGLERRLGACAEAAVEVAVKSGDPCGRVLAEVLDVAPPPVRRVLCDRLHSRLPEQTVALLELAEVVTRERVAAVRPVAGHVLKKPAHRARLSQRLDNYGQRLHRLGRLEDARDVFQEALAIDRGLERGGNLGSEANVGIALAHLGNILSELGCHEEALKHSQQALRIHRHVARARPDRFAGVLAISLGNTGNRLAEVGRFDEALVYAEEGLQIHRRLAVNGDDASAVKLAGSLQNVSNWLSAYGRFAEALANAAHALQIRRGLAETRPDAFTADVAMSLGTVAYCLSDSGQFDEALTHGEEAHQIYRRLAEARPDAFAADLAASLLNLGVYLSNLGRFDEALDHATEGVEILRHLAASRPDRFGADLARNLGNLALLLMQLGRELPAQGSVTEALDLMAQQPGGRSAALQGELCWTLAIHAWSLLDLGDPEAAAIQANRACDTIETTLINRPRALPQPAALAYWVGWRCAAASGDTGTAQHRADQALWALNLWVENGAVALPAYLVPAAGDLLDADDQRLGAADRYPALKTLLHRRAIG